MNRVQRKCLFASAALHGLLVGIVFVGPAFLPRKPQPPNLPILTYIPDKLIDEAFSRGGNPNGRSPTPQPPVQQPTPPASAPAPEPAPVQPAPAPRPEPTPASPAPEVKLPQPEPEPPAPKPQPLPRARPPVAELPAADSKEPATKTSPPKAAIKVNKEIVRLTPGEGTTTKKSPVLVDSQAQGRANSQVRKQAVAQVQKGVSSALDRLAANLSSGTSIEPFGPGGGGEVYASWHGEVYRIYEEVWDKACRELSVEGDNLPKVPVRVKVAPKGTVLTSEILQPPDNRKMAQAVQLTLDRVRDRGLPGFPEGAADSERLLNFNFVRRKPLAG